MKNNWFIDDINGFNSNLLYWNTSNLFAISAAKNASTFLAKITGVNSKTLKISYDDFNDYKLEDNNDSIDYLKLIEGNLEKSILILIRNPYNRFLSAFHSDTFGTPESHSFLKDDIIKKEILEFAQDARFINMFFKKELYHESNSSFISEFKNYYKKISYLFLKKYFEEGLFRDGHNSNYLVIINKLVKLLDERNIQYRLLDLDKSNTNELIIESFKFKKEDFFKNIKSESFENSSSNYSYFLNELLHRNPQHSFIKIIRKKIIDYLFDEYMIYNDLSKKCINYK